MASGSTSDHSWSGSWDGGRGLVLEHGQADGAGTAAGGPLGEGGGLDEGLAAFEGVGEVLLGGAGGDQFGLDLGDALGGRAVDGGLEVLPGLGLGPRAGVGELGLEAAALGGELLEPGGDARELLEQGVGGRRGPARAASGSTWRPRLLRGSGRGWRRARPRWPRWPGAVSARSARSRSSRSSGTVARHSRSTAMAWTSTSSSRSSSAWWSGSLVEGGGDVRPAPARRPSSSASARSRRALAVLVDPHEAGAHDVGAPGREADPVEDLLLAREGGGELALPGTGAEAGGLALGVEHHLVGLAQLLLVVARHGRAGEGELGRDGPRCGRRRGGRGR